MNFANMKEEDVWRLILSRAELRAPSTIAGGCVRDHILGLQPNDIDVFVDVSVVQIGWREELLRTVASDVATALGKCSVTQLDSKEVEDYEHQFGKLCGICELDSDNIETKIQIIGLDSSVEPSELIKQFDLSLSCGCYTTERGMFVPEFMQKDLDVKQQTLLMAESLDRWSRSQDRWSRLKTRHPAVFGRFKLVDKTNYSWKDFYEEGEFDAKTGD